MLIVCPTCATSYNVEPASLLPNGRQVRCLRCYTVWGAAPSHAEKLLAAAAAIGPARAIAEDVAERFGAEQIAQPPAQFLHAPAAEAANGFASVDAPADQVHDEAPPADGRPLAAAEEHEAPSAAIEGGASAEETRESAEVEAPPIAPVDIDDGRPPVEVEAAAVVEHQAAPHGEDIETVAARRYRRRAKRPQMLWPLSHLQTGILALALIDAVLLGWRSDVVRALPQTASLYAAMGLPVNLRGLAFDGVVTTTEQHEGVPIIAVEGNIVNKAGKTVNVPHLKFILRNAAKQDIYSWTAVPPRQVLPPGEAVSFRARLASPPPETRDVLVRFVNRRDLLAGMY